MGKFTTPVILELLEETGERPTWRTVEPVSYLSDKLGLFTVPKDFICDLASVPRVPFVWLFAGGRGIRASILHDYAYSIDSEMDGVEITRAEADELFHEALLSGGEDPGRALAMYEAVNLFAGDKFRK